MATCDLPDLDEFAEEEEKELLEERYLSLDNLPITSKGLFHFVKLESLFFFSDAGLNPGDVTYRTLCNESATSDIHSWWTHISKK